MKCDMFGIPTGLGLLSLEHHFQLICWAAEIRGMSIPTQLVHKAEAVANNWQILLRLLISYLLSDNRQGSVARRPATVLISLLLADHVGWRVFAEL